MCHVRNTGSVKGAIMNRPIITIILAVLVLGVVLGYAARTFMLTQNISGFPGGQTSIWLLGQNTTLVFHGGNPPPVDSNGSIIIPTKLTVTCGGAATCAISTTITGPTRQLAIEHMLNTHPV